MNTSDWSKEASSNSGFLPPQYVGTTLIDGAVEFLFSPRSDVDALVVRRATTAGGPHTEIAIVNPTSGDFVDTTTAEGQTYYYTFAWRLGAVDGTTSGETVIAPLLAPSDIQATVSGTQVDLSWANHSLQATEVVVLREDDGASDVVPQQAVAYLPPSQTSYSDTAVPPGPHTYRIEARAPQRVFGGRNVQVFVLPAPADGTWNASFAVLPLLTSQAALDSQGRVVSASLNSGQTTRSDSPAWAPHDVGPPFQLDSQDRIHTVQANRLPDSSTGALVYSVVHEWLENESWHSEELIRGSIFGAPFTLDSSGHPVVAVFDGEADSIRVLCWSGTGYRNEDPGIPLPPGTVTQFWIAQSADDVTHVVAQSADAGTAHAWRDGSWSSETTPLPTGSSYTPSVPAVIALLPGTGGALSVLTLRDDDGQIALVRRDVSGWSAPTPLFATLPGYGLLATTSPDGTLSALVTDTEAGSVLASSTDGWLPHALTAYRFGLLGLQYDTGNHLVAILGVGSTLNQSMARAAVYHQQ